jgi:hypothetical protein
MENYIIELRNKESLRIIQEANGTVLQEGEPNGVWTTNIQAGNELYLEEGDTLICRNSYIDTKAEAQQKIIISEPLDVSIKFYYYAVNWNGNAREYISNSTWRQTNGSVRIPINPTDNRILPQSDGKLYIACDTAPDGANFRFQKSLTYVGQNALQGVGGFNVFIRYNDVNGQLATKLIELPAYFEFGWGTDSQLDINVVYKNTAPFPLGQDSAIACFLPNTSLSNPEPDLSLRMDGTGREFKDTRIQAFTDPTVLSGSIFTPKEGFVNFTIPTGNYDPNEICETINSLATEHGKAPPVIANLADNQLLVPISGTDSNGDHPNSSFNNFIRFQQDGDDTVDGYGWTYQTSGGAPNILGASQFVLDFDEDTNRFSFQFLHTPIYSQADGTNGGDSLLGGFCSAQGWSGDQENVPAPTLPTNRYRVGKNGGILLTELQPASLWSDQLGFDLNRFKRDSQTGKPTSVPNPNCILVACQQRSKNSAGVEYTTNGLQSSLPLFYTLPQDGIQMTNGFLGVNTIFEKASNFQKQVTLDAPAITGGAKSHFVALEQQTQDITAGDSLFSATSGLTTFGYFLIEVQAQFQNNFLNTSGNFKHIVAIVSRYYEKESYTSSTSADSIVYTHSGEPALINSFNCRILDSDKRVATNIGNDNTVILELVKAPKQIKK